VEIRPADETDRAVVETLVAEAFGEGPDGRVVAMMRALVATGAARTGLVAATSGGLVGHVGLARGWVDSRRALVEVRVLSPLAVRGDHRNRGIGTALVAAALATARGDGVPAVFLEGDWAYYGRRGFEPAVPRGFGRPSARIPQRAFQVAVLSAWAPWMTGRLVYPEAFWTTDTVGLRDPRLAEVEARAAEE
jgi:putative acetyltransferase